MGLGTFTSFVTMRRLQVGFTLIELLFVMAVIAILSSLALPSYQHTQQKGQRTLAKLALAKTAHWLERAASVSGKYPSAVPDSVQVHSQAQSFTLIATPMGAQAQDDCGSLTLGHTGERGVQNAVLSASQCWER